MLAEKHAEVDEMLDVTKPPGKDQFEADIKLIDASMKLATFGASRSDARRGYEWKISFGVWALLAATVLHGFTALPFAAGVLLLLMYGSWLQSIWLRNASDAELMWHFVNEVQRLISVYSVTMVSPKPQLRSGRGEEPAGWRRWIGFLSDFAFRFQFFVTLGLTVIVYAAAADRVTLIEIILK